MQQRSLETRRILMEATLDSMCELGYHQSSTTEIIRRAGVSRGAMLHHYPTKVALLSATFEYLHDQISRDVERLIEEAEKEGFTSSHSNTQTYHPAQSGTNISSSAVGHHHTFLRATQLIIEPILFNRHS